jgi:cytochrome c peroxidase
MDRLTLEREGAMLRAMKPCVVVLGLLALVACQKKEAPSNESTDVNARREAATEAGRAAASAAATVAAQATPKADEMNLPADFGKMKIPEDNPQSEDKIELGHQLFFDKRLSVDGSRSCYSCHTNEDGNGGKDPLAIGAQKKKLTRHSPVIWNVGFMSRFYWDGRSVTLEEQALAAWAGGNMGVGKDNLEKKAKEIGKIPGYKTQFEKVFPGVGATPDTIVKAISAYERALVCDDTTYDRFAKGNRDALNEEQKRGLELFMGKAGCVACHTPPFFSSAFLVKEGAYFNTGVGIAGKKEEEIDVGRKKISNQAVDFAAFKVPSLRNVSKSAPYFHDGSATTLEAAVRFMASGGHPNPSLTPLMTDKKLSDTEVKALLAFFGTLDCPVKLAEPKKLP